MRLYIGMYLINIIFIETACVCVVHTVSVSVCLQASKSLCLLRTLHMYIASVASAVRFVNCSLIHAPQRATRTKAKEAAEKAPETSAVEDEAVQKLSKDMEKEKAKAAGKVTETDQILATD